MALQKYYERNLDDIRSGDEFRALLKEGWKIIIAVPVQTYIVSTGGYGTFTKYIHYVLEKEEK